MSRERVIRSLCLIPSIFSFVVLLFFPYSVQATTVYPAGNALSFDGDNDWVDATGNGGNKQAAAALGLPVKDITLEAWVKPRTYLIWRAIVSFLQDNAANEYGWDLEVRNGNKFAFALNSVNTPGSLTYMESTNTFATDQWHHVAGVYDGAAMKIYVNGELENTSAAESGNIRYANSWLAIGQYKDDNEAWTIDADIDEVRIWNVARSQEQIKAAMNKSLIGNEAGLVAYYKFNEGIGGGNNTGLTTLPDVTSNGYDGQLNNFAGLDGSLGGGLISNWVPSEAFGVYTFVPTLSQWGMIVFAILLGGVTIRRMKRFSSNAA